jgi:nicotinamidase-related amidase
LKSALLILDVQNGFIQSGSFDKALHNMESLATYFKEKDEPVILTRHIDQNPKSLIQDQTFNGELYDTFIPYADAVFHKKQPSAFKETDLETHLKVNKITNLIITGFNVEYCCLFNSIIAHEKGFSVTFIEDASATVNTDETYEMPGLDIRDFVATVLHWSGCIQVVDTEEYIQLP